MTIDEFMRDIASKTRKGWIAMDKDGEWYWYAKKPTRLSRDCYIPNGESCPMNLFDISSNCEWTQSLREVGKQCHI